MKTDIKELKNRAKELVLISKQKGIIKPHTEAFKDFPVKDELHEEKIENVKKKARNLNVPS